MTTKSESTASRFLVFIFAWLVVASAPPALAQKRFYIFDLNSKQVTTVGPIDNGEGFPYAINDLGQVAGSSSRLAVSGQAFLTGPNGQGMIHLGTLGGHYSSGTDINSTGQVVGYSATTTPFIHAFVTGPNGQGMSDLGRGHAIGINDIGQITGELGGKGFITGPNGQGITYFDRGSGLAINDAGQVVGNYFSSTGQERAFITGPDGQGITDLGTLGGNSAWVRDINNAGQVVGYSATADGTQHGFITGPNGQGMSDLGTLNGAPLEVLGMNDAGQVVGVYYVAHFGTRPFVTGPNGAEARDLMEFMGLPVTYGYVFDINNRGQVVGALYGLVPEPESYVLMAISIGLTTLVLRRRRWLLDRSNKRSA